MLLSDQQFEGGKKKQKKQKKKKNPSAVKCRLNRAVMLRGCARSSRQSVAVRRGNPAIRARRYGTAAPAEAVKKDAKGSAAPQAKPPKASAPRVTKSA